MISYKFFIPQNEFNKYIRRMFEYFCIQEYKRKQNRSHEDKKIT